MDETSKSLWYSLLIPRQYCDGIRIQRRSFCKNNTTATTATQFQRTVHLANLHTNGQRAQTTS